MIVAGSIAFNTASCRTVVRRFNYSICSTAVMTKSVLGSKGKRLMELWVCVPDRKLPG